MSRTCPLTRRRTDPFMAHSTRNHDRTTPAEPASSRGVSGAESPSRDRVASSTHLVLGNAGWANSDLYPPCRTPNDFCCVPGVDRSALVAPPDQGSPLRAGPPSDRPPRPVALHPLPRGSVERADRKRVLRRATDDVRLGWTGRQRGTTLAGAADAGSGDRLPAFRLLRLLAPRSVAGYLSSLSSVQVDD